MGEYHSAHGTEDVVDNEPLRFHVQKRREGLQARRVKSGCDFRRAPLHENTESVHRVVAHFFALIPMLSINIKK